MGSRGYIIPVELGKVPYLMFVGQELHRALSAAGIERIYSFPGNYDYILGGSGVHILLKGDVGKLEAKIECDETVRTVRFAEHDILLSLDRIMRLENSSFPLGGRPKERVTS